LRHGDNRHFGVQGLCQSNPMLNAFSRDIRSIRAQENIGVHSRAPLLVEHPPKVILAVIRSNACDGAHRPFASPTTSGGSGQSSVSPMARSSSASRTVTSWFARMQAVQATTIRRLMSGTD